MVVDAAKVRAATSSESVVQIHRPQRLEKLIEQRKELLTNYQNSTYAEQYITYLDNLRHRIGYLPPPQAQTLLRAVAQGLYKLMAYKDEYEVARLLISTNFKQQLAEQFEGDFTINYNLAPPLLAKKDANGRPKKIRFGPWMGTAMGLLAKLKFLRGTRLDVFGYTQERKTERALVQRYKDKLERSLEHFLATSDSNTEPATQETNWQAVINAAQWADQIRGFGHVKELAIERAEK
jgi:indolepyruvate ferredoxin oxidoreductase